MPPRRGDPVHIFSAVYNATGGSRGDGRAADRTSPAADTERLAPAQTLNDNELVGLRGQPRSVQEEDTRIPGAGTRRAEFGPQAATGRVQR